MIFQLENNQAFSRSMLWDLQRQYFEKKGFDAWRLGEVPHYVTSNPRIANSYAELVIGLYKDTKHLLPSDNTEPIYLLEAGAGSGRLGYYLIKQLHRLCDQENIPHHTFCYILSDFTQRNPDFWKQHPAFQTYLSEGLADIALWDMTKQDDITLQISGKKIRPGSLGGPLVLIANYVFDSIPQELFYTANGKCSLCKVSLQTKRDPAGLSAAELLREISCSYQAADPAGPVFTEPWLNGLLDHYRQQPHEGYFFFPETGIRSLAHLRSCSEMGLLVITADKGAHEINNIVYTEVPELVKHGSFSLSVNYHAISNYAAQSGGFALFPEHRYASVNTGCIALLNNENPCLQTRAAFTNRLENSGPDDYFTLYQYMATQISNMPLKVLLSMLRFSLYDSHLLAHCLPRLQELGAEMSAPEKEELITVMAACWENYFSLGEKTDLASEIAAFLYGINLFDWAVYYFKMSADIYGHDTGTLFNIAACYQQSGEMENAKIILDIVLKKDPDNAEALSLLQDISNELINTPDYDH
ncbi:MAG: tetratricopeptide repeat protein [Bacteroidota bacterium]